MICYIRTLLVFLWIAVLPVQISANGDYKILPSGNPLGEVHLEDEDERPVSGFGNVSASPFDSKRGKSVRAFGPRGLGWLFVDLEILRSLDGALSTSFWTRSVPATGNLPLIAMITGDDRNPPEPLYSLVAGEADTGARFVDLNAGGFLDQVRRYNRSTGVEQGSAWINVGCGWLEVPSFSLPKAQGGATAVSMAR